ncbi:hypothetical protein AHF37_04142, partial [Paragonimus kellicotti]
SLNASHHALFLAGIQNKRSDYCSPPRTSSSVEQVVQFPEGFDHFPLASPLKKPDSSLKHSVRRWSSCSTIFIGDGCLISPHQEATLWSVAVAVELLIQSKRNSELCTLVCGGPLTTLNGISEVSSNALQIYNDVYSLFDERKFSIVDSVIQLLSTILSAFGRFHHVRRGTFNGVKCAPTYSLLIGGRQKSLTV